MYLHNLGTTAAATTHVTLHSYQSMEKGKGKKWSKIASKEHFCFTEACLLYVLGECGMQ